MFAAAKQTKREKGVRLRFLMVHAFQRVLYALSRIGFRHPWLQMGPLFRKVNKADWVESRKLSDKSVANIVKRMVTSIGGDSTQYAGHSLRSGFATSSAAAGANERDIMRQTGHKSVATVRRYTREGELFRDNAAFHLGLWEIPYMIEIRIYTLTSKHTVNNYISLLTW